jgi:uncharacterized membrane protein YdjX (TVP38/TMEM64 family)
MKRHLLLAGIVAVLLAGYFLIVPILGLSQVLTNYVDSVYAAHPELVARYYPLLLLGYFAAFALTIVLCLPLAALMVVIGGLVFGFAGFVAALLAITIGSIPPFLAARRYGGPALAKTDAQLVQRFRHGFERNQFQYLVLMRLIPWAPFPVTTVLAGALGMGTAKFLIGTALGFVPAGLALNAIGHGLGRLGELRSISVLDLFRDPDFLLAAAGVSAIALLSFLRRVPALTRLFG